MSSVKRRLIYVPDENETTLHDLSGTPPRRSSRLSFLPIISSSNSSKSNTDEEVPPYHGHHIDKCLLISYDGFLLADGSGRLSAPRNRAEGVRVLEGLRDYCTFLQFYLTQNFRSTDSGEENDSKKSFSTDILTDEVSLNSTNSAAETKPRGRAAVPTVKRGRSHPSLRRKLLETKESSGSRPYLNKRRNRIKCENGTPASPESEVEQNNAIKLNVSDTIRKEIVSSTPPQQQRQQLSSTNGLPFSIAAMTDGNQSRIWGAIASVGSILFRQRSRSSGDLGAARISTSHANLPNRPRSN